MVSELANFLRDAELGEFSPEPYYDKDTDRLRILMENKRFYSQFVNRFLTLFLTLEDDEVVGFQIDSVSIVMLAIEGMGPVKLCEPVSMPNGVVEVAMLFRQAAMPSEVEPDRYAAINEKTRGLSVPERLGEQFA